MDPYFIGSASDWVQLGRENGILVVCHPVWRGMGTALLVISRLDGGPLPTETIREFRELVEANAPIGAIMSVAGVG